MARLIKEREVDQDLYEALSFTMRDDEDLLAGLEAIVKQDIEDTASTADADRLAGEAEQRARDRAAAAEHELSMARHELALAHEQRIHAKRIHAAAKTRQEHEQRIVKALRIHIRRTRLGISEWAGFKGFSGEQLADLQITSKGGLRRLIDATQQHGHAELSQSEAEAI